MQEEIENRTVTLIISAVKLTARELKAGMDKYLSEKKSKAMEKARGAPEKPTGKQTVKQLIGQNQGVSNIEITNSNIKGFERIARKEGFSELREIPLLRPKKGAAYGRTDPRQYHHDPEERADHCCGVIFQSRQHRNIPRQAAQIGTCRQLAFIRV